MLKHLHTDIIWIMMRDIAKRCDAGEISLVDYARESEIMHREIIKRFTDDTLVEAKQMHADHKMYADMMEQSMRDYEAFIVSKGLTEESDEFFDQLVADRSLKDGDDVGVLEAQHTPLSRFVLFLYGIVPKQTAERIYRRLCVLEEAMLQHLDDEIFNELAADGKIKGLGE